MLTYACEFVLRSVWGDVQNLARIGDQVLSVDGVNLEGTQFPCVASTQVQIPTQKALLGKTLERMLTYADVCV